jgi:hypothetical protein
VLLLGVVTFVKASSLLAGFDIVSLLTFLSYALLAAYVLVTLEQANIKKDISMICINNAH